VEFATGLLTAVLSAVTFILVLWTIGGTLTLTIAGAIITIPGFLVVAAVIYAVLASGSMVFIGRRFVTVSENKNQAEAEYRYVLTRLRENGESIAVLGGEEEERRAVDGSLTNVLRRWRQICFQTIRTTIVSQTSGYIAHGASHHSVRAEISQRHDDTRAGDAGGLSFHHCAGGVQLAGRQLSAPC
jgi:putative ATP-binding cassette transporter